MTNEDSLFEFLEADTKEHDRSLPALVRNFRQRLLRRTVIAHNHELGAALKFPYGFSWRKANGLDWCPYCTSLAPWSMQALASTHQVWDPLSSVEELHALISRGEMKPSRQVTAETYDPLPGYAWGSYIFDDNEPKVFCLTLPKTRIGMMLEHLYDADLVMRSALITQMNRMAPSVNWSIDADGFMSWSHVSIAVISEVDDDDDDEEEDDGDDISGF